MGDLAEGEQGDVVGAALHAAEETAVHPAQLRQFLLADALLRAPRLDGRAHAFQDVSFTLHMLNIILTRRSCQPDISNNLSPMSSILD